MRKTQGSVARFEVDAPHGDFKGMVDIETGDIAACDQVFVLASDYERLEKTSKVQSERLMQVACGLHRCTPAVRFVLDAAVECERRYSLHVPWPVAEELRLALIKLIKDCPHTQRFNFAGGEWQCERCGKQCKT